MLDRIEDIIEEKIKPALATHDGDIEVIDLDNGKLYVRMLGRCVGCSAITSTIKDGIERILMTQFPDLIEEVVDLTDHTTGENPYY